MCSGAFREVPDTRLARPPGLRPHSVLRAKPDLLKRINLICPVQPRSQKHIGFRTTQITSLSPPSRSERGALAIVTNVGMGCGGRGSVVARGNCRAGLPLRNARERSTGAWTNGASTPLLKCGRQHMADLRIGRGCCGRQNRVVLAPVAGAKSAEVRSAQPGATRP